MNPNNITSKLIAIRIWIFTTLVFGALWIIAGVIINEKEIIHFTLLALAVAALTSIPVGISLAFVLPFIKKVNKSFFIKIGCLLMFCLIATLCYGIIGSYITTPRYEDDFWTIFIENTIIYTLILFACACIAIAINIKTIGVYFNAKRILFFNNNQYYSSQTNTNMDTTNSQLGNLPANNENLSNTPTSNKILIKGVITGVLILVMLIPTVFITNLITERKQRQSEIVHEVSSKWGYSQTITGPYLYIPYTVKEQNTDGKIVLIQKQLFIFPDSIDLTGEIFPEQRLRSIYSVLLYKSILNCKGNFNFHLPSDIDASSLQWSNAKICIGINDFKGIEEKISINFNNHIYTFTPGLPINSIDACGLSSNIILSTNDINKPIAFNMELKINGSEQLHFIPLSGNSNYTLHSSWPNPFFDGNTLPKQRTVTDKGFTAKWYFNAANLPFGNVVKEFDFDKSNMAFGVSMLQPADQYAKTMRSVKYAILIIGLSFSLFFIIELMQKNPLHPIQYVLVGLGLIIFYTLLLSISEFLFFNYAYGIASFATILLITLYVKNHFKSLKIASLFGTVLIGLYGFIFVLIQLEDTALLVGSIGLFIVLALVMYASRKINWYSAKIKSNE